MSINWTLKKSPGLSHTQGLVDVSAAIMDKHARDQLIPVVHETTYKEVRKVSPLLGSRHGLETAEDSMEVIATEIAELVHV